MNECLKNPSAHWKYNVSKIMCTVPIIIIVIVVKVDISPQTI